MHQALTGRCEGEIWLKNLIRAVVNGKLFIPINLGAESEINMRRKKVWRFYCEYCKKANCSGASISKHEKHCTMNPSRDCGMCRIADLPQAELSKTLAILPDPKQYEDTSTEEETGFVWTGYTGLTEAVEEVMQKVRDATENCPACIMAALRQRGIPIPAVTSFDFTAECKSWWSDFNDAHRDDY